MTELSSPWVTSHSLSPERQQELHQICDQMQAVSKEFYVRATHIGNHAFIEFCGLMNEYIKACRDAIAKDVDFTQANVHTGKPLPLTDYQLDYIAEKFSCIYGESFAAILPTTGKSHYE
jgi:hypothetical protein